MASSLQAHQISALALPLEYSSGILPIELVLHIIRSAIVQNRMDELPWCLSVSLVCHAVRTSALPILYKVLFLSTISAAGHAYTGWDGKEHKHVGLAFLTWLLHDRSAPPRHHIKHLMFRHQGVLGRGELLPAHPRAEAEAAEWPIQRLTVEHVDSMYSLRRMGLRPQQTFQIGPHMYAGSPLDTDLLSTLDSYILSERLGRVHVQAWPAGIQEEYLGGETHPRLRLDYIACNDVSSISADASLTSMPQKLEITLTIHFVEGDYLQQYPKLLLTGITELMSMIPVGPVILACGTDYRIAGQPMADFIHNGEGGIFRLGIL